MFQVQLEDATGKAPPPHETMVWPSKPVEVLATTIVMRVIDVKVHSQWYEVLKMKDAGELKPEPTMISEAAAELSIPTMTMVEEVCKAQKIVANNFKKMSNNLRMRNGGLARALGKYGLDTIDKVHRKMSFLYAAEKSMKELRQNVQAQKQTLLEATEAIMMANAEREARFDLRLRAAIEKKLPTEQMQWSRNLEVMASWRSETKILENRRLQYEQLIRDFENTPFEPPVGTELQRDRIAELERKLSTIKVDSFLLTELKAKEAQRIASKKGRTEEKRRARLFTEHNTCTPESTTKRVKVSSSYSRPRGCQVEYGR